MAQIADPRLSRDPLQGVAVRPPGATRDDQPRHSRTTVDDEGQRTPAPKVAIGREQPRVVLARFDGTDREDKPRIDALWERPGGHRGRHSFRYHLDLFLEPGNPVELEQVAPRRLGGNENRRGLAERWRECGAKVKPLLPGHLAWPDPKGEVVNEDRGRRRAVAPEWRAGPVRVEDGVCLQLGLHRGQPSRFQDQLVAIRREDRLAIELAERFRPLPAAQEHELVL